jgi:hypothetical protein
MPMAVAERQSKAPVGLIRGQDHIIMCPSSPDKYVAAFPPAQGCSVGAATPNDLPHTHGRFEAPCNLR